MPSSCYRSLGGEYFATLTHLWRNLLASDKFFHLQLIKVPVFGLAGIQGLLQSGAIDVHAKTVGYKPTSLPFALQHTGEI